MVDFGFGVADPVQHGILPWPGSALGGLQRFAYEFSLGTARWS